MYASPLQPDEKHERSLTLFAGLRGLAPRPSVCSTRTWNSGMERPWQAAPHAWADNYMLASPEFFRFLDVVRASVPFNGELMGQSKNGCVDETIEVMQATIRTLYIKTSTRNEDFKASRGNALIGLSYSARSTCGISSTGMPHTF